LRAFRKKAARAGIYASVVRVEFLTLSGPMVPTPFISPSMAGGCDAAGEPWRKLTGTGCSGRSEAPNDVKAARRLPLTLRVAGTAKAGRAHHRHELAGTGRSDLSTRCCAQWRLGDARSGAVR